MGAGSPKIRKCGAAFHGSEAKGLARFVRNLHLRSKIFVLPVFGSTPPRWVKENALEPEGY
jgi:hypothetical protein